MYKIKMYIIFLPKHRKDESQVFWKDSSSLRSHDIVIKFTVFIELKCLL